MMRPLCFVVMPFGRKKDLEGNEVDFDLVYSALIKPAIVAADLEPIRADEETINGIIHKPMYERLILCDYAVADLTTANANVFYELGIRHAIKPCTTITLFSASSRLPFDLHFLRSMPYQYDHATGSLLAVEQSVSALRAQLLRAKQEKTIDSPVYQLVDGIAFQNSVAHEKTDIFRDLVKYKQDIKDRLAEARELAGSREERIRAVEAIVQGLVLENEETGVLVDVMLSYRAIGAYEQAVAFIKQMPAHVQQTRMVQEQLGFALNRAKKRKEAIAVLERVLEQNGPSSETYGILGRVYKDLFQEAYHQGQELLAESYLDKALEAYQAGFEADWRDAYPGVNAVTLLALKGEEQEARKLAPVVEYAVQRKLAAKRPDYWDYATLLEIAVIANCEAKSREYLKKALSSPIEGSWMLQTTLQNLQLLHAFRTKRGEADPVGEKVLVLLAEQVP
ncbi:TRAFs-binding domain-containing protein [Rufibacter psychrotolerans]|uniref:TRAFs-binding domain-containing protein n=1 Tax=Rufibacter psychrotolerans TaxID=2812556 RepID=UPI0019685480|nr:TRAFs-binding domain-containing protein [Rufibacter sp. SYSU D00308]